MICELTGKQCLSRGDARSKVRELAPSDPQAETLNVYKCEHCHRHHVGHRRMPGDLSPARRLNQ